MTKFGSACGAAVCLALLAAAPAARAAVITASGSNNSFAAAQDINGFFSLDFNPNIGTGSRPFFVNTSTVIPNVTVLQPGATGGGVDYYRFTLIAPGVIILDIDSSASNPAGDGSPPQLTSFDTQLHLFNAAGTPLASNDDNADDPGDIPGDDEIVGGSFNSRIQTGLLPAGDYVVAVAGFLSAAEPGGVVTGGAIPAGGAYTLQVSANAAVPEPAGLTLAALALAGAAGYGWSRRRKA